MAIHQQQHAALELLTPRQSAATLTGSDLDAVRTPSLTYSSDSKYLFQRDAHVIRVFNSTNGQLLHECIRSEAQPLGAVAGTASSTSASSASSSDRQVVTAIALHPHNALQLIAAYADGKILVWDFTDEKILLAFDANAHILWMDTSTTSPSTLLLVIAPFDGADDSSNTQTDDNAAVDNASDDDASDDDDDDAFKWSLIEFSMKKMKRKPRVLLAQRKVAFTSAAMQSYATTTTAESEWNGDLVVVAAGERLWSIRIDAPITKDAFQLRSFSTARFYHVRAVTAVAVHPWTPEFVIGDAIGQLHRFFGPRSAISTASLHWHAHAVATVAYSSDGAFFVSGGDECVLVTWHIESGRRTYLPRRSAAVQAIATRADGSGYAISLADNVLFQYNHVTREQEWHVLGLARCGASVDQTLPSRTLVFDPLTHAIVLNGTATAGVLQFYDQMKDRVVQSVVLTERNHVTRTEDDDVLPTVVAQHVGFSSSGHEMATLHASTSVALGSSKPSGDDQSLQFWKRRDDRSFAVTTAIDAPHGSACVTAFAIAQVTTAEASSSPLVVTGDANGVFKVWTQSFALSTGSNGLNDGSSALSPALASSEMWSCQSVVHFRTASITSIAIAADCSVVAVAYGQLLTLWDVATHQLRHVLSTADGFAIQHVAFLQKATSPFLLLQTALSLEVWNLVSHELWWRYDVPLDTHVRVHPTTDAFVVWLPVSTALEAMDDSHPTYVVMVFTPASPVPVDVRVVDVGAAGVWSVAFDVVTDDLIVLDGASNVWRLAAAQQKDNDTQLDPHRRKDAAAAAAASAHPTNTNAFAALFPSNVGAQNNGIKNIGIKTTNASTRASRALPVDSSNNSSTTALFDAPAHVLPSMTALYRSFMDTMLPKPQAGVDADDHAAVDPTTATKKTTKKRKKYTTTGAASADAATPAVVVGETPVDDKHKRMKHVVEAELANPALQQQTYSKLLEALRQSKTQAKAQAKAAAAK